MRRTIVRTALLAALLSALPDPGSAQAICSAPHSSPTLAGGGTLKTLPAGGGWVQLSGLGQRANEFYSSAGNTRGFIGASQFDTRSAFLTGSIGVLRGLEAWAQVPFHRLTVQSLAGDTRATGIGDVRVALRAGSELLGFDLPVAVRLGAKFSGSDFPVDATQLPLTEGQTDWEASLESGMPIGMTGLYVMGWTGYRWREENATADRKPGNELFAHAALGGSIGAATWEIAADGLWGEALTAQGFVLNDERRRLIQILPTLGYGVGPGRLEVTGQIPLSGRNLPVGRGVSVGYRIAWGLEPEPVSLLDLFPEPGR